MRRLETSFKLFSRVGVRFLLLELLIVFLGVYLAFYFQNRSEERKIAVEKEKVMVGLKEDLEYFRIAFPGFVANTQDVIRRWDEKLEAGIYEDFSSWRFIQPQYDYKVVEYALNADAEVVDFELNSALSQLYLELEKLQEAERLITEIAMRYQAVPELAAQSASASESASGSEITPGSDTTAALLHMARMNNHLNLQRLRDRSRDRVEIMQRIVAVSESNLEDINATFTPQQLEDIELMLIGRVLALSEPKGRDALLGFLKQGFPHLTEARMRAALDDELEAQGRQ